jgi:hypothetical protein
MPVAPTQPTRHFDSERERLRRRRDRHARLATDRALTEVAFKLRARARHADTRPRLVPSGAYAGKVRARVPLTERHAGAR